MLTIRMKPTGKKGTNSWRIVVSEKRNKLIGKTVDDLGNVNVQNGKRVADVDRKKLTYWREHGVVISDSIKKLLS